MVYLHLFHGRDKITEQLDDWGFDGPTIGPLNYVHTTYASDVKFSTDPETFRKFWPKKATEYDAAGVSNMKGPIVDGNFNMVEDMIAYDGKFYGDWSVTSEEAN